VPQEKLLSYLKNIGNSLKPNETPGMDASVVKCKAENTYLCSTTDFFYPLIEDPYMQGRIACANVLSDLYAMGIREVDTMLMILGVCTHMSGLERDVVTTALIRGFNDLAKEADTNCTGGQTVLNPWPIIGGTAHTVCRDEDIIRPVGAVAGDVLILTKPLGTQVAVNLRQWAASDEGWAKVGDVFPRGRVADVFEAATLSMARLNKTGAELMHTHGAHAATDVTGFGILGHAENLAKSQNASVDIELHTLPVLEGMAAVDAAVGNMFKLVAGYSAETSGGLMLCIPEANAQAFIDELTARDGEAAWVIGRVVEGSNTARVLPGVTVLDVPYPSTTAEEQVAAPSEIAVAVAGEQ
jgi:selenide,water dikinase